jgi:hypothetical protein
VGVLPVAAELFPAHARLLEQNVDDLDHLWALLPDPPPSGRLTLISEAGCHPAQPDASAEGLFTQPSRRVEPVEKLDPGMFIG